MKREDKMNSRLDEILDMRQTADGRAKTGGWAFTEWFKFGWQEADKSLNWVSVADGGLPPKIEGEEHSEYCFVAGYHGQWYDVMRYDYRRQQWLDYKCNDCHTGVTHWLKPIPPEGD